MDIYLTNSLSRTKEKFVPINPPNVGMYSCGPTVYDYAHIGHGRKYVTDDILKRLLTASGYKVKHVENVTDVGHLVSDADTGEDKLEKGAAKTGKTVWEVAEFFTKYFYDSMDKLNIIRPDIICKATDHIKEQIELVQKLVDKGYAYDTPEAVYFDVTKFKKYDQLFGQKLEEKKVGVRESVQEGEHKKHPQDFALWFKRVGRFENHTMHWESPWGDGFPGWHVECSTMSMKYLGEQFDIHTGGEDHLSIHHPNEIAQSEAATGKEPFVKYWIHTAFLMVDGRKMSKSLNNFYTVDDIEKKGFDPLSLRYLYLGAHYRDPLNFTWESLTASQNALEKLRNQVASLKNQTDRTILSGEKENKIDGFRNEFMEAVGDDLNTPKALAVTWDMLKSNIPSEDKYDLAMSFDEILGLKLNEAKIAENPENIKLMIAERDKLRSEGKYEEADNIRAEIQKLGFSVSDKPVK
jgi:cysteinyl-tRNA synthetase